MTSPDHPNRIPQLYGYAVCLIAVVSFLFAANNLVNSTFDFVTPERSRDVMYSYPESYEAYRSQYMSRPRPERYPPGTTTAITEPGTASDTPPDSALRRMYNEERIRRIEGARYQALRSLVTSMLMVLVAAVLFFTHWRFARKYT